MPRASRTPFVAAQGDRPGSIRGMPPDPPEHTTNTLISTQHRFQEATSHIQLKARRLLPEIEDHPKGIPEIAILTPASPSDNFTSVCQQFRTRRV